MDAIYGNLPQGQSSLPPHGSLTSQANEMEDYKTENNVAVPSLTLPQNAENGSFSDNSRSQTDHSLVSKPGTETTNQSNGYDHAHASLPAQSLSSIPSPVISSKVEMATSQVNQTANETPLYANSNAHDSANNSSTSNMKEAGENTLERSPASDAAHSSTDESTQFVCGVLNTRGKPCQRIGFCPFHAGRKASGEVRVAPLAVPRKEKKGWSPLEHQKFLQALSRVGEKDRHKWVKVSKYIKTRTPSQVQSHAQKFRRRQMLMKDGKNAKRSINDVEMPEENVLDEEEAAENARLENQAEGSSVSQSVSTNALAGTFSFANLPSFLPQNAALQYSLTSGAQSQPMHIPALQSMPLYPAVLSQPSAEANQATSASASSNQSSSNKPEEDSQTHSGNQIAENPSGDSNTQSMSNPNMSQFPYYMNQNYPYPVSQSNSEVYPYGNFPYHLMPQQFPMAFPYQYGVQGSQPAAQYPATSSYGQASSVAPTYFPFSIVDSQQLQPHLQQGQAQQTPSSQNTNAADSQQQQQQQNPSGGSSLVPPSANMTTYMQMLQQQQLHAHFQNQNQAQAQSGSSSDMHRQQHSMALAGYEDHSH
eukprot:GCRY01004057.1.p1 GENE.GCRY01004057.1~~GCRY01004057.1.p1  ORF type:complete len:592 (+),score=94.08 GCRY01004057.1:184-1959(+)